ncbi:MAG: glycerophosphodiester phosphodiesterase [Acidobacteriia bacterium]|nr:glycerophosphodiester phosphodiesterase [Terriglobia bacterium]
MKRLSYLLGTLVATVLVSTFPSFGADAPQRVEVHGHRGARAMRPENTIPAFEYAIAAGVDVLELDMAVTKDNVIVISHDPVLRAPTCTGPQRIALIHQLTLKQVREWDCGAVQNPEFKTQQVVPGTRMPTLDEVFQLAPKGKFRFNIETKISERRVTRPEAEGMLKRMAIDPESEQGRDAMTAILAMGPDAAPSPDEFVKLVLEKIRKYHVEDRVMLQSFDFRTLHAMKKLAPEILLVALTGDRNRSFVEIAKEADASVVSPEFQLVTPEKVREAHAAGLQVVPYTANKTEDWDRLIAARVDAIITDDPAGLIKYLRQSR